MSKDCNKTIENWYKTSTVRSSSRIILPEQQECQYFYPPDRQMLVRHELIKQLPDAIQYILVQTSYRYMYEIAWFETQLVIASSLDIVNDKLSSMYFSNSYKQEALAVIIDEGYHAYVALDFIQQLEKKTGIYPIEIPSTNQNIEAVKKTLQKIPSYLHKSFELIAVCLAEHTLTKDLLKIIKKQSDCKEFNSIIYDHIMDEQRHAGYFARILAIFWKSLTNEDQALIRKLLPEFLHDYLEIDLSRSFDKILLKNLNIPEKHIKKIIGDTNELFQQNSSAYIATTKQNLEALLKKCGVLDYLPI